MRHSVVLLVILLLALCACSRNGGLPDPDSSEYRDLVSAFYVGLAGLQTGEDVRAKEKLTLATEIAPGEPASWANLGLLAVRHQEFDTAYENVERARSLAPDNSRIEALLGLIESRRGNLPEAIQHLRRAVELDSTNLRALYALAQETERQGTETSDTEAQQFFEMILETQAHNLAVMLDVTRLAAKRDDRETLREMIARLSDESSAWSGEAKQQLIALQQAASGPDPRSAATQVAFLRNVLAPVADYRLSLDVVRTPAEFVGEPFLRFIKLPSPGSEPASPDLATRFEQQPIERLPEGRWNWIGAIAFNDQDDQTVVVADNAGIHITGGAKIGLPRENTGFVLPVDFNYDFKTDLIVQGRRGVRFFQQESVNAFIDVTDKVGLPAVLRRSYIHAGTIDIDLDGDLDIWLSPTAPNNATRTTPIVLRNKGDGTFGEVQPFRIVYSDRDGIDSQGRPIAVWQSDLINADFDSDGDPDAAMLSDSPIQSGWRLRVFSNERLGQYLELPLPDELVNVRAMDAADIDGDSVIDLVAVLLDGRILRLSAKTDDRGWDFQTLATLRMVDDSYRIAAFRQNLSIADLDNNGALDLIVESTAVQDANNQRPDVQVFLNHGNNEFTRLDAPPISKVSISDVNGDGRLELLGLVDESRSTTSGYLDSAVGRAAQLATRGSKNYKYQTIRTRAAKATGDQRINSFGIGGEIEIRSRLLTQKQIITSPVLHFGLGENTQTDVTRIVWPNGSVQAEFELNADQSVLAEQRLKGSCPMLFAWDGNQISYVKDTAPWSPALGLRINAQIVAGIYQTEEWFKIRGEQLSPRADSSGSFYDLRVTAELWETYYIDHYSLMVVDHPRGTEVFVDERFAVPPPPLKVYATDAPKPFAGALDDLGHDVSNVVRDLDQKYLDTFGKGRYQGVTRDHFVELELPENAPRDKQLYLIGHGFIHPTDGSINVAYGQMTPTLPQSLTIETPDAQGNWKAARSGQGFPAGKLKTIVLDLNNSFRPGAPRRLRLRTNMEIYWDKLEWAEASPDTTLKTQRIGLSSAELLYRGFSKFSQADDSSPEIPDYNQLQGTVPKWRDLIGYYTRHGEVLELLERVDDRMVIVNSGDEIRLKFAALPPPPPGWTRDYVMVGDGWIKDGDLNSTFSKTVLPLPYHGLKYYNAAPGRLEDDPAYKRHPQDWQKFHTRYVTPDHFLKALRGRGLE